MSGEGTDKDNLQAHSSSDVVDCPTPIANAVATLRAPTELGEEQTHRSLRTFIASLLDLYKQQGGRGMIVDGISLNFDQMVHHDGRYGDLPIHLPKGNSAVSLITRDGPGGKNLYETKIVAGEIPDGPLIVSSGRMEKFVAGQLDDGTWKLVGNFERILDEHPHARIKRLINERCIAENATFERRYVIAAEVILSQTIINNPYAHEFGGNEALVSALGALENAASKSGISSMDDDYIDKYMALPEFRTATQELSKFLQQRRPDDFDNDDDFDGNVNQVLTRPGTTFLGYETESKNLDSRRAGYYRRVIEITIADKDRLVDEDTLHEQPQA